MRPRQPLRVGLVGAGNIAAHHLQAYLRFPERVELVAVCDIEIDRAQAAAAAVGGRLVFADAEAMIREAGLDAVDICTPHDSHAAIAIAAAEAGLHVLVEKPMAATLGECLAMLAAADHAGTTLMVAQNQRYLPAYRAARALMESDEIGKVRSLRSDSIQNWRDYLPAGHWQYDGLRAGGGVLINVGVHRIDLLRYLVGNVRSVVAAECRTTHTKFLHGAEDTVTAIVEYENGALGSFFATAAAFRSPWSEQFVLYGERGTLHTVPPPGNVRGHAHVASCSRSPAVVEWADQFGGFEQLDAGSVGLPTDNGQINEILHFADCCRSGEEPISSGRDNLETMKVVFGIYEAARRGAGVQLADLAAGA